MASDVIFSENTVYNNDSWGSQNGDGYGYQYNPHNTWFIFNKAYDVNFGIRQSDSMSGVYSEWSLAGGAYGQWYIFFEVWHNGVLYYCKSTHVPSADNEPGVGINWENYWVASDGTVTDAYDQRKVYILGNDFHDIYPRREGAAGTYIANDMFRSGVGIALWRGNEQRWVINNTIVNAYDGITVNSPGNLTMEGNIISGPYATGYQMDVGQAYAVTNSDYNNWYDSNGTRLRWNGSVYNSSSALNAAKGQCAHCIDSDPLFVDTNSDNYQLQSNSPAIDADSLSDVYATFNNLYGVSINYDIAGIARPQNSLWDIGAYEYAESGTDIISPASPSGLNVL